MFTVSEAAATQIRSYFQDKQFQPIRVYLAPGGCSGPRLSLALDEKKDGDDVFEIDGLTFLIEGELMKSASPVGVDISPMGFTVSSSLKLGGGCGGGCGSGGGASSCSC